MEIEKTDLKKKIKSFFVKEKVPFASKTDVDWKRVSRFFFVSLGIGVIGLFFLPSSKKENDSFHEKNQSSVQSTYQGQSNQDPTTQAVNQMNLGAFATTSNRVGSGSGGSGATGADRGASMILTRGGLDAKTQVPAGSRISVKLTQAATVASSSMPVIGLVTHDYIHEDSVAIPAGSKLFGDVSFDSDNERAKVEWKSIVLPDGRQRQFSAVAVGSDGQVGIEGNVHSNGLKNTVGATISRFVGAYAQGSMQTGFLGANPGGADNGWKNAVSQTASDEANSLADGLKKERKWIELDPSSEFFAVLTANFVFRDPGATNGR